MGGGSVGGGGQSAVITTPGGRFYRNAPINITGTLSPVPMDANSVIMAPDNVVLGPAGELRTLVAGKGLVYFSMRAAGLALLTGVRVALVRSPGTPRELILADGVRRGVATLGDFTIDADAAVDLDVDDTVQVQVAAQGVALLALSVGSEVSTWARLVVL